MNPSRRTALVIAVYLGSFMATLDVSIVTVALPTMQHVLQTDMSGLQWIVDIYALCLSALMLSAGAIGDRYGRKKSWLAGALVFTLGSALCGLASGLPTLLAGRAVQGVGAALLIPGALSILTHAFPNPGERARIIGGWSSFTALSLVVGPVLGGLLVEHVGWSSIFLINLPIGLMAMWLGAWGIPETSHPAEAALDPLGQVLSVLWLGALAYGMISANEQGWASTATLAPLSIGGIGFAAFLLAQATVARPLLPLSMFRNAGFSVINFSSFVLGFSAYNSVFFLPLFFQQVQGWTPSQTGWALTPQFASMSLLASFFGRIAQRHGLRRAMAAGYGLIGAALLALAAIGPHASYPLVGAILVVLGAGMGLAIPASGAAIMATVPKERSGMASSTTNAIRQTGVTLGIALLATLMTGTASTRLAQEFQEAGVPDAAHAAYMALSQNKALHVAGLDAARAMELFVQAYMGGFHVVMACAATLALIAAALLMRIRLAEG